MTASPEIGVVIIGRNEGERLMRCLASIGDGAGQVIYVDSGSTDGSQTVAEKSGATVVALDMTQPFTAARARNAGFAHLRAQHPQIPFVQFIDGDCALRDAWLTQAHKFLLDHPQAAVVCGRRREQAPEASIYNRLIDQEWDTPLGQTLACGGDALMRVQALEAVGLYNPNLIAGEEPELCVRLRKAGWEIWRIAEEMTWHDAAITRFGQWWKRASRAGFAYAEAAVMHGAPPERHGVRQTYSALIWGLGVPLIAFLGLLISPLSLLFILLWPLQVLRLSWKGEDPTRAFFLVLGKLPETQGILRYWFGRLRGRQAGLIEYK